MTTDQLKKLEGPAFACIIATLCALAFQKPLSAFDGVSCWFVFTVLCGLYFDPLQYSWKGLFFSASLPAAWLVAAWAIIPAVGIVLGDSGPNAGEVAFYKRLLILGPLTFVCTTLAIPLWALAKQPILDLCTGDPNKKATIVKNLQAVGLIASLLLSGFLYLKNFD
jgi:hypothetical protein